MCHRRDINNTKITMGLISSHTREILRSSQNFPGYTYVYVRMKLIIKRL